MCVSAAVGRLCDSVMHALEVLLTPHLFTFEVRRAWSIAYSKVVAVMIPMIAANSDKGHHVPAAVGSPFGSAFFSSL